MEKIIIIGGKGTAVVVAEQIYDTQMKTNSVEFLGFAFDDEAFGDTIQGFPVLCKTKEAYEKYEKYDDVKFIYQLYQPAIMQQRVELVKSYGIPIERFATFIHHSVYVARSAKIGHGSVILSQSTINPNVKIGNCCTITSNNLIGHDTQIGDYNFIAAQCAVGSNTKLGIGNFIGLKTSINNYTTIGDWNFVGMGSNVIKGFENNVKVYGNPAKEFNKDIKAL